MGALCESSASESYLLPTERKFTVLVNSVNIGPAVLTVFQVELLRERVHIDPTI